MANTDKNIVITPNTGQTADPNIVFSGADATTAAQNITLNVLPDNNGTLSFEGSQGQLFSITNDFTGTIFAVSDVSGIPSIEVLDDGTVKFITPIRDQKLSRETEIEYLKSHGYEYSWEKSKYSINQGLWGTSVGGAETLTSDKTLPEEAYPSQLEENQSKNLTLDFKQGELVGIDGENYAPVEAIKELQKIARKYAIGRDIHVGDTIIGIKGRVGFEAAAPMIIIKAHELLEKHTLSKWQLFQKQQLAQFYGMMAHEGLFLDEVMRNTEVYMQDCQRFVTGKVFLALHPYRFELIGIESRYDQMKSSAAQYGEMNNSWTADDAKGFIKIYANGLKNAKSVQDEN